MWFQWRMGKADIVITTLCVVRNSQPSFPQPAPFLPLPPKDPCPSAQTSGESSACCICPFCRLLYEASPVVGSQMALERNECSFQCTV